MSDDYAFGETVRIPDGRVGVVDRRLRSGRYLVVVGQGGILLRADQLQRLGRQR